MKILIASTPATGHLNPMLAITQILRGDGHEIAFLTGTAFRARVEASGVKFFPLPEDADFDPNDVFSRFPELKTIPPGLEWFRVACERIFVDAIPAQHQGLLQILRQFPADIIVADDMLFGVLPMLLGPRSQRPPIALCGTSFLHWAREDGAPNFLGSAAGKERRGARSLCGHGAGLDAAVDQPVSLRLNRALKSLGVGPIAMPMFHSVVALGDAYLQLSVPSFEFPREIPPSVHFVGTPTDHRQPGPAAVLGRRARRIAQDRSGDAGNGGQSQFQSAGCPDAGGPRGRGRHPGDRDGRRPPG